MVLVFLADEAVTGVKPVGGILESNEEKKKYLEVFSLKTTIHIQNNGTSLMESNNCKDEATSISQYL